MIKGKKFRREKNQGKKFRFTGTVKRREKREKEEKNGKKREKYLENLGIHENGKKVKKKNGKKTTNFRCGEKSQSSGRIYTPVDCS